MKKKDSYKEYLISIAAPSGPFDRQAFQKGVRELENVGLKVKFEKGIFSRRAYLAGEDKRRAGELNRALQDKKSKALLFARGGYGCQRILPLLRGRPHPKVVVGSSDLTVLLAYLWKCYRLPSYYGPMVAPHLILQKNARRLARVLSDPTYFQKQRLVAKKKLTTAAPGRSVQGRLVGGCLSLVIATLGTPWEIDTRGSILFLEDTNEPPYKVDRMLTQLEQAGKLRGVRGIVLGTFRRGRTLFPSEIETVFRDCLRNFTGPVLWGLRFGHCPDPLFIPVGRMGRIVGKNLHIVEKTL